MSTVKITRSQIRELILDEQARRGDTVEAIVDEILMTAPYKKERLGSLGEMLVQKLIPGSKNLNKIKLWLTCIKIQQQSLVIKSPRSKNVCTANRLIR